MYGRCKRIPDHDILAPMRKKDIQAVINEKNERFRQFQQAEEKTLKRVDRIDRFRKAIAHIISDFAVPVIVGIFSGVLAAIISAIIITRWFSEYLL